jgi:hypothetical protein
MLHPLSVADSTRFSIVLPYSTSWLYGYIRNKCNAIADYYNACNYHTHGTSNYQVLPNTGPTDSSVQPRMAAPARQDGSCYLEWTKPLRKPQFWLRLSNLNPHLVVCD